MNARIVLAGVLVSMVMTDVSAQRAEYDDMYFRGKDRERHKSMEAEAYASAKPKKQKNDALPAQEEAVEDNTNPTDSYSARNVNPEYVSRANSEKASEDESNYYLEGYIPPSTTNSNYTNSYYNNITPSSGSYYANNSWNSPYYGTCGACSPYGGMGYYDPWMSPAYGYGPSYGWRTGWSISFMYGNYWNPYGGYGMYSPYYPYYGGGYPYYGGGNSYYYEPPRVANSSKRPSRHSAVVQPTERTESRTRNNAVAEGNVRPNNGTRQRQTQDEYYVRPSRRPSTSTFDNPIQWGNSNSGNNNSIFPTQHNTQNSSPSRSRDSYNPPSYTPSYTPSPSPSPSRGGGSGSGGGGGSSPRPRGGRD